MTWYFTSDPHFFHENVIRYCKRPFRDAQHMNESLIANWNARVTPSDDIFCLGDFGMADREDMQRLFDRLQGRKHLVAGNHDKTARKLRGWQWVKDYHELRINRQRVILFHYAMRVWRSSHKGSIALYGHSHGSMPGNSQSLDVGVDCWDYRPVTLEEIQARMAKLPKYTGYAQMAGGGDHHEIEL